jgi:hypothetical protein
MSRQLFAVAGTRRVPSAIRTPKCAGHDSLPLAFPHRLMRDWPTQVIVMEK